MSISTQSKFFYWVAGAVAAAILMAFILPSDTIGIVILGLSMTIFAEYLVIYLPRGSDYHRDLILGLGLAATVVGWAVNDYFNNKQLIVQKKRDLKVKLLLDSYYRLENSDHRENETKFDSYIYQKYTESAIQAIQLLGDKKAVSLARCFAKSNGNSGFGDLLVELRSEIRKELDLSEIPMTSDFIIAEYRTKRQYPFTDSITSSDQIQFIIKLNEFEKDLLK